MSCGVLQFSVIPKSSKIDTLRSPIADLQHPFMLIFSDCGVGYNVSDVLA